MKRILASSLLFLTLVGNALALADERIIVKVAPPQPRKELIVARPSPNHVWIAGFWKWEGTKHVWVDGHWVEGRPGYVWVPGHWKKVPVGWEWIEGHWRKR